MEEVSAEEGEIIFSEGDEAHCMYIIFKGQVRIHKQNHTLAVLKENDFFGELSLLDTDTRSASATANSEALLLKIDQEPFYELMESRIEVAKNLQEAESKEIEAKRQIALSRTEAEQQVGLREAEKQKAQKQKAKKKR